jgi:Single Cache domain 2
MVAHGANKGLIGKPQIDMKDAEGWAFIQELAATMANATETWSSLFMAKPRRQKDSEKEDVLAQGG